MPLKEITADDMQARVLYRDGLMLIVDKPAGLPVHRGPKGGVSLEDYFDALRFGLPRPPALAHRLDKDSSGCLVLGRHRKALAHLGLLFKHGKVGKTYWAVVEGGPDAEEGTVELSLGRLDERRGGGVKPGAHGRPPGTPGEGVGRARPAPRPAGGGGRGGRAPPPPPGGGGGPTAGAERAARPPLPWPAPTPAPGPPPHLGVPGAAGGWRMGGNNTNGGARPSPAPPQLLHAREV